MGALAIVLFIGVSLFLWIIFQVKEEIGEDPLRARNRQAAQRRESSSDHMCVLEDHSLNSVSSLSGLHGISTLDDDMFKEDVYTDPAYSFLPGNVYHQSDDVSDSFPTNVFTDPSYYWMDGNIYNTSTDGISSDDYLTDPAYSFMPGNIYNDDDMTSCGIDDSFSSSCMNDDSGSGIAGDDMFNSSFDDNNFGGFNDDW